MSRDRPGRRLSILHLGYEDFRQPGSGGGSLRTHEINRRLAKRHDVTVVAAGWPGTKDRTEDGVRYTHTRSGPGHVRALTYFAALPRIARQSRHDLIVEDFGAPFSTVGVPRFTRIPVVASVQWLFARQKSREYRMPFWLVEEMGLRAQSTFIVVSEALKQEVLSRRPSADVTIIPNGVAISPREETSQPSPDAIRIVFLGRLERQQKGLDTLLDAVARVPDAQVLIAGDGSDEQALKRHATSLGLDSRVQWLGRVDGEEKSRLLHSASIVAMPSRYETFGIVCAEALAAGSWVVASDLPCLRELLPPELGLLVPPADPTALADALNSSIDMMRAEDDIRFAARRTAARKSASPYDWDAIAESQERLYLDVVG